MKKTLSILALATLFAACSTSNNNESADSTAVAIDTLVVDTTAHVIDTVATEPIDPQATKK